MSQPDFAIDGKPVKDMSDDDISKPLERANADAARSAGEFNQALQKVQVTTAVLNVLRYELNRRANKYPDRARHSPLKDPRDAESRHRY